MKRKKINWNLTYISLGLAILFTILWSIFPGTNILGQSHFLAWISGIVFIISLLTNLKRTNKKWFYYMIGVVLSPIIAFITAIVMLIQSDITDASGLGIVVFFIFIGTIGLIVLWSLIYWIFIARRIKKR